MLRKPFEKGLIPNFLYRVVKHRCLSEFFRCCTLLQLVTAQILSKGTPQTNSMNSNCFAVHSKTIANCQLYELNQFHTPIPGSGVLPLAGRGTGPANHRSTNAISARLAAQHLQRLLQLRVILVCNQIRIFSRLIFDFVIGLQPNAIDVPAVWRIIMRSGDF